MRRLLGIALVLSAVLAPAASASYIVDRNASRIKLQVDATGHALVSYVAAGKQRHVLIYGALNGIPPTKGKAAPAFKVDYSGGYGSLKKANYYKTIKSVCKAYDGPKLAWLIAACKAPDGTYWALQSWQRMLPNLGFRPWLPEQAVDELHISHWQGPIAQITVDQDWAWGGQFEQLVGRFTYLGKPVYGFGSTTAGAPTDSFGRLMFLDTYQSAYFPDGWARENSFLAQQSNGQWCYSLGPRDPSKGGYPGYPKSGPRQGNGTMYRITAQGPGVSPDVFWIGNSVGKYDPNDSNSVQQEQKVNALIQQLGFSPSVCHS